MCQSKGTDTPPLGFPAPSPKALKNSTKNKYIQSVKLNGTTLNQSWFHHKDLVKGGTLEYVLGEEPNYDWATAEELLPSSMSD